MFERQHLCVLIYIVLVLHCLVMAGLSLQIINADNDPDEVYFVSAENLKLCNISDT